MKALLVAFSLMALSFLVRAIWLMFRKPVRREQLSRGYKDELKQLATMAGGTITPANMAACADAIASSISELSTRIEESSEQAGRLGEINLLLACVIATATLAYAVVTVLRAP